MRKFNHNFKKSFGQNFLRGYRFAKKLIDPLELTQGDLVIEIGPGDGSVTNELLNTGANVVSVELDYDLLAKLLQKFSSFSNFELVHSDILEVRLDQIVQKYNPKRVLLVGSLPYNISKQIIKKVLEANFSELKNSPKIHSACFIVQEEVAQDYVALPPKASFLSNYARLYSNIRKLESIPASQFFPRPKVNGGILYIKIKNEIESNIEKLAKFIKAGFSRPNKTLANNLKPILPKDSNKKVEEILSECGIDIKSRAGNLDLEQWKKLFAQFLAR